VVAAFLLARIYWSLFVSRFLLSSYCGLTRDGVTYFYLIRVGGLDLEGIGLPYCGLLLKPFCLPIVPIAAFVPIAVAEVAVGEWL